MAKDNEVITGTDYKRMIIGAYSEFILEYEGINQVKKNGRFFYCGMPGTDVLRTMGAAVLPLQDSLNESIGGLARRVADAAVLGGLICGSMLGATVVFTIPVALGILEEEDRPVMAKGILCGVVTIPVGILVGGLVAGFSVFMVLRNLIPIVLIGALIALGLWKAEKAMIRGFAVFGKGVVALITAGLALAIVEELTGFAVIPGMAPLGEGFLTVGAIAVVLAGAFPLVAVVTRLLQKPLGKLGGRLGINHVAAAGLIASLANSIATFGMVKDMDQRGKVVNIAFAVSAAFVFGDHLGYGAGFAPQALPAMIAGKLAGGICAVAVALWLTKKEKG